MPAGRPPNWKTPQELQEEIDQYFNATPFKEWAITGLGVRLGCGRQTLMDYEHKDEFTDTVKKAKQKCEWAAEMRSIKRGNGGDVFTLKQYGWKDERHLDHTTDGQPMFLPSEILNKNAIT